MGNAMYRKQSEQRRRIRNLRHKTSVLTDGDFHLLSAIDNPNPYGTTANDYFGRASSICDNYALIGAPGEGDAGGINSGKAYIYEHDGTLRHIINNPNVFGTSANDSFGWAVSASESYAVVGAYSEDAPVFSIDSGRVYVFNPSNGLLIRTINNPTGYYSEGENFGFSVKANEKYIAVGAPMFAGFSNRTGRAFIFDAPTGQLLHTINNPNPYGNAQDDYFGVSVDMSDLYLIVGSHYEDTASGENSGKAYIFDIVTGALLLTISNPNAYGTETNDLFGFAVAITDKYAVVGAYQEDNPSKLNAGATYIFDAIEGTLLHTIFLPQEFIQTSQSFGWAVSICEDCVAITARNGNTAYIYDVLSGSLLQSIVSPIVATDFGISVGITPTKLIVGNSSENTGGNNNSGRVYIFERNETSISSEIRSHSAYWKGSGVSVFQTWTSYPNSSIATVEYPFQFIGEEDSSVYLFVGKMPWLDGIAMLDGVYNYAPGQVYQLISGGWSLLESYPGVNLVPFTGSIVECNHDISTFLG